MLLTLLLLGCPSKDTVPLDDTGDTADSADTAETGETGETGDTNDSGETGDTGETGTPREGLLGRLGEASVSTRSYDGWEEMYLIADSGDGDDVCRIRMTYGESTARTDCALCDWAFDLTVVDASIVADTDPGCLATLGYDSSTVGDLVGTTVSYGYIAEYYGHTQMLVSWNGSEWVPTSFCAFDQKTGTFTYDWEDGLVSY